MSTIASLTAAAFHRLPLFIAAFVLGTLSILGGPRMAAAAPPDQADEVEIFDRDVSVIVGSTLRNPDATTAPDAPLFNNAGVSLNLTWGKWQEANAESTVHVVGGNSAETRVSIDFTGLVADGVYSVFWGTLTPDSENPLCPGVERTLPVIGTRKSADGPDASSFIADASGNATFTGAFEGNFLAPLQAFFSIVYHSDGETYHPLPNAGEFQTQGPNCHSSFGEDAMRQLVIYQKF